jgi:hypothetical protein
LKERYYVAAYWQSRKESLETCANKGLQCLQQLTQFGYPFAKWYEKAETMEEALHRPVDIDLENVKRIMMTEGEYYQPEEPFYEWGYRLALWSYDAETDTSSSLSISCGCTVENVTNRFILYLPQISGNEDLFTVPSLLNLLSLVIAVWSPQQALVTSSEYTHKQWEEAKTKPSFLDGLPICVIFKPLKRFRCLPPLI